MPYPFAELEPKWQRYWEEKQSFVASNDSQKPKFFCLIEFPYPSGEGLHVGHPRSYTALDILARKRRFQGYNVLYPIGWDAFGLPSENFAIKTGIHPAVTTKKNIATFTRQLKSFGFSFDWSREFATTDPAYYKWTQWIFLQFVKHGLAYKTLMAINWCPQCKIGLANEEVVNGNCERCGHAVEKRDKAQWMLRITDYAQRLLEDLQTVDYAERIKAQQVNWIGRSEGASVHFKVVDSNEVITVYTTRVDTIFSGTFVIVAPEHPILTTLRARVTNWSDVATYVTASGAKTEIERTSEDKEKTGVELQGVRVINPATGEDVAVWVSDFVLGHYGHGAVFADAHDDRDFAMAKKYGIPLAVSIQPTDRNDVASIVKLEECFSGEGILINSGQFNGLTSAEARPAITHWLAEQGAAEPTVNYKLRDWVFSRQRYWGEPIPLVHCDACAQQKPKVLLIHGFEGSMDANWFPWLRTELESRGYEVLGQTMSASAHPTVESWVDELQPLVDELGEHDMIVAHSLGSKAALHVLERSQKKIGHLLLVASAIGEIKERDWQAMEQAWADPASDFAALKSFWQEPVDLNVVDGLVGGVSLVVSADDDIITHKTRETLRLPVGWHLDLWDGHGHFDGTVYPALLKKVLSFDHHGWVPLPDAQLPVLLPDVEKYQPTDSGESPLATIDSFVQTTCPHCGGPATRETDTMPNWAGSSWYFLRYTDPHNDQAFAGSDSLKYWTPIDWYNGGMEHTTLHLLYSRFWHKFLHDVGYVPTAEPYSKRTSHGLILGEGGEKMSKSRGNVVNPDEVVQQYGADAFRVYEMFMGPFSQPIPWDTNGLVGVQRFLDKVWDYYHAYAVDKPSTATVTADHLALLHKTIKKVGEDIETQSYNTAVSALMILFNSVRLPDGYVYFDQADVAKIVVLLSPFAPHIAEELWQLLGQASDLGQATWPSFDEAVMKTTSVTIAVQVNGKLRGTVDVATDASQADVELAIHNHATLAAAVAVGTVVKIIFVPNRLINFVVSQ